MRWPLFSRTSVQPPTEIPRDSRGKIGSRGDRAGSVSGSHLRWVWHSGTLSQIPLFTHSVSATPTRIEVMQPAHVFKVAVIAPRDEPSGDASEVGSVVERAEVVRERLITRSDDGYLGFQFLELSLPVRVLRRDALSAGPTLAGRAIGTYARRQCRTRRSRGRVISVGAGADPPRPNRPRRPFRRPAPAVGGRAFSWPSTGNAGRDARWP